MSLVNDALPLDALPESGCWPNRDSRHQLRYPQRLNVAVELIDRQLRDGLAGKPAVRFCDKSWTYGQLAERVNRLANALAVKGVKPGDRVVIHLPNVPEFIECWLAVLRIGGVVVATPPMLRRREIREIVLETAPRCVLSTMELDGVFLECDPVPPLRIAVDGQVDGGFWYEALLESAPAQHSAAPTSVDDVAIIAYTSGSTGKPKGTIHTHGDLLAIADTYAQEVLVPRPRDCFAGHPSLAFTYGLGGLLIFPLRFGASVVLDATRFDPARWMDFIRREKVTVLFSTPTACRMFLQEPGCGDRSTWQSVRTVVSAGQHLPAATFNEWRRVTGVEILDGCGSTELLHIWISQRKGQAVGGCSGVPVSLYEARLLDDDRAGILKGSAEGIIAIRGPTGCRYWRRPAIQAQIVSEGWTLPGDRFRRDAEGRYWHLCRTDDLINSGGYKIAPAEIEEVLLQHPSVLQAGVVGVLDDLRGEVVCAYIVGNRPALDNELLAQELRQLVKREIASFKCPQEIRFVESLPHPATGNLDRGALRRAGAECHTVNSPKPSTI